MIILHMYFDDEQELHFAGRRPALLNFPNDRAVAIANILAAGLMEILGPLFWAVLILLFFFAEFSSH